MPYSLVSKARFVQKNSQVLCSRRQKSCSDKTSFASGVQRGSDLDELLLHYRPFCPSCWLHAPLVVKEVIIEKCKARGIEELIPADA